MKSLSRVCVSALIITLVLACSASPLLSAEPDPLVTVFQDNNCQFTGVALSPGGRIFLSYPNWLEEHTCSVAELTADGKTRPCPDEKWNSWKKGEPGQEKFVSVQAVQADSQDCLWVVDTGNPQMEGVIEGCCKLVKINLKDGKVEHVYLLDASVAPKESYVNDVAIDTKHQFAYLTDSGIGGIILLNLKTGKARKVLEKNPATLSDPAYSFKVGGRELSNEKGPVKIHSDGLVLSPDEKFLYFKPLTDIRLFRIETKYFFDPKLKPEKLGDKVEKLGTFCTTDGIACDKRGNLYLGDITSRELIRYDTEGKTEILLKDDRLMWPDSYAISKDGFLYFTCSQIHLMPWFNEGKSQRTTPYTLFKFKLPEPPAAPKDGRGKKR